MVKWYNASLPRTSRGFDYPWPHKLKKIRVSTLVFFNFAWVIEKVFEIDSTERRIYPKGVLRL